MLGRLALASTMQREDNMLDRIAVTRKGTPVEWTPIFLGNRMCDKIGRPYNSLDHQILTASRQSRQYPFTASPWLQALNEILVLYALMTY